MKLTFTEFWTIWPKSRPKQLISLVFIFFSLFFIFWLFRLLPCFSCNCKNCPSFFFFFFFEDCHTKYSCTLNWLFSKKLFAFRVSASFWLRCMCQIWLCQRWDICHVTKKFEFLTCIEFVSFQKHRHVFYPLSYKIFFLFLSFPCSWHDEPTKLKIYHFSLIITTKTGILYRAC